MFECPKCHTGVPKWKSATMSNFTKIKCETCGATLKPDRNSMQKIGGIGTVIALPIALIAMRSFGFMGIIFVIVIGFLIACIVTVNITTFEIVDE